MQCRMRDLRCKEVINISDGCRLGFVSDVDIRIPEGQVIAIDRKSTRLNSSH